MIVFQNESFHTDRYLNIIEVNNVVITEVKFLQRRTFGQLFWIEGSNLVLRQVEPVQIGQIKDFVGDGVQQIVG